MSEDAKRIAAGSISAMKMPRLLDMDLKERGKLAPVSLSVELNIDPLSTADMKLPHGALEVASGDFVEVYTPYGSAGIFRAWRTDRDIGSGQSISMRHGIVTLADDLIPEGDAVTAPVREIFQALFSFQTTTRWVLGDCDVPDSVTLELKKGWQTLLSSFTSLTSQLPDGYAWEFDQSSTPWVAHLRAIPAEEECELRLNRNAKGVTISMDRDEQCTRLYAFGVNASGESFGLDEIIGTPYLDAEGVEPGNIISKAFRDDEIRTPQALLEAAQKYIDRHKNPEVSISVEAVDVYAATGLTFDRFHLGKMCRVPMPDYGITVNEKVVSIRWPDLIADPCNVRAYLSSRLRDATDEIAGLIQSVSNTSSALDEVVIEVEGASIRLSEAEKSIIAQAETIRLQGVKVDDNGNRIDTAYIEIDGVKDSIEAQAETITAQAKTIAAKADLVLLDAYVKANELEASILYVATSGRINNLIANTLTATSSVVAETGRFDTNLYGTAMECSLLTVNDSIGMGGQWYGGQSAYLLAGTNPGVQKESTTIFYKDSDGTDKYVTVLTNVSLRGISVAEVNYLGY